MAEYYGYFNGLEYDEDFVALVNKILVNNGVFDDGLMVSANSGMTVEVAVGAAIMDGFLYYNDAPKALTLETANASLPRIDSIMLRWNISGRTMNAIAVTGTAQSNPVAPAPVRDGTTFDFQLATVRINAGVSSVTAANITDTRPDESVCGITSGYNSVDIDALMTQYTAEFNDWFEEMKDQLSTDAAGNLQTQINAITDSKAQPNGLATLDSSGKLAQMPAAADVGAVPVSRTVNGKALSGNITLTAADVGAALPNLLLNSDFAINQRGQTSYSNGRYTADRWYNSSAGTVTIAANTLPGSAAKNQITVAHVANSANTLSQPMENLDSVLGQELIASFWAKAQNAGQMRVGIANDVDAVLNVTTAWQRFTVHLKPTAANPTWTVNGLFFQSASNGTSSNALGSLTIAEPQLVYGTYAGVYTPPIPAEELVKCQRYYYVSSNNRLYGYTQATNETSKTVYPSFAFSGGFRTVPQVTMPSGGITIRGNGVSTVVQAVNNVYMTETEVSLDVTTAAAIGNSQAISGWFDTANPTIFDAEIYA